MTPYHIRIWQQLEKSEQSLELDEKARRQLNKNKEHILGQKMALRLQQAKVVGIDKLEEDDFNLSFNISKDN